MRYFPIVCAAIFATQVMLHADDKFVKPEIVKDEIVESLVLNNVPIKEAARLLGLATHSPIIVSTSAAQVLVDVHVKNLTAEAALKSICQSAGLWYQKSSKDGLIHIMTLEEFKNSIQFDRSEKVEVVQILYPAAEDIADALAKLYADRVIFLTPKDSSGNALTSINDALERMDAIGDRGIFEITESSSSSSSSSSSDDDDDDDYDENKSKLELANQSDLSKLDNRTLQSMLAMGKESSKGVSKTDLLNKPGTVFIAALPENNNLLLRSSDASAVEEMLQIIQKLDKPTPQVLLEVKILSIRLSDAKERAVDLLFANDSGSVSGGFDNGSLTVGGGNSILKSSTYDSATGSGLLAQGSGINDSAAIFSMVSENIKARIQILETNDRATTLASPNLLVCNNESTTLFMGTETTVMEKAEATTTYLETSTGGYQPNVSWSIDAPRRQIGTALLLTPKIHADRTVTLRILQEKSSLGETVKNVYSGGTSSTETEDQYFESQDIDMQRIVTTTVGKDREFMVLGGLINEEIEKIEEKIPGLCDIPIIGELLFTRMSSSRVRNEILVIIRPFVMLAPGETQMVSQSYLERMSQHPAAREDLPSLGINKPSELAKPTITNPNDPFYIKLYNTITGWSIDTKDDFSSDNKFDREDRRRYHQEALQELERIQNEEK